MSVYIYSIRNRTTDKVYVGSTKQTLKIRLGRHRGYYNQYEKGEAPQCSSFEIMKCPTAYITLLEECNASNRFERERYWISITLKCVNITNPKPSLEEHKEYHKLWVERNETKLQTYRQEYYIQNKNEIQEQHKLYNETNKAKTKERCSQYYQLHREEILAKNKIYKDKIRGKITSLT